jgi:hypothetical protein
LVISGSPNTKFRVSGSESPALRHGTLYTEQ